MPVIQQAVLLPGLSCNALRVMHASIQGLWRGCAAGPATATARQLWGHDLLLPHATAHTACVHAAGKAGVESRGQKGSGPSPSPAPACTVPPTTTNT